MEYGTLWSEYKELLLKMAKEGADRPKQPSTLGCCLSSSTCSSTPSYDYLFDLEIRELRPDWFKSNKRHKALYQDILIELAKYGLPRPSSSTKLGRALANYCKATSDAFDEDFSRKIHSLRLDWFKVNKDQFNCKFSRYTVNDNGIPEQLISGLWFVAPEYISRIRFVKKSL